MSTHSLPDREFFDCIEYHKDTQSLRVTARDLVRFDDQNIELADMIGSAKAELAERCVKGTMVTVSGKVKSSTYVQGEIKKWTQEVQVETIEFVNGNCNVEPSMPEDDVPFK